MINKSYHVLTLIIKIIIVIFSIIFIIQFIAWILYLYELEYIKAIEQQTLAREFNQKNCEDLGIAERLRVHGYADCNKSRLDTLKFSSVLAFGNALYGIYLLLYPILGPLQYILYSTYNWSNNLV